MYMKSSAITCLYPKSYSCADLAAVYPFWFQTVLIENSVLIKSRPKNQDQLTLIIC